MVLGPFSVEVVAVFKLATASFSSASSFALIDKLIERDLRSTLMILASTS